MVHLKDETTLFKHVTLHNLIDHLGAMSTGGEDINVIGVEQGVLYWWVEDLRVPEFITCCEEAQQKATLSGLAISDKWLVAVAYHSLLAEKYSLTSDLSLKGCRNSNGLGKSGNPTSKTHRRYSSASSAIPTPPWIPSAPQTQPRTSMELHKTETPFCQQQTGFASRILHQALSLRTSSSSHSADSWTTWRLQRPMTMLFFNRLSPP